MVVLRQFKFRRQYTPLIAMVSFFILLSACDGDKKKASEIEPGYISFSLVFNDAKGQLQHRAADADCSELGIVTIEAMVYNQDNVLLAGSDRWACDTGQGSISSVPAGSNRIVAIVARGDDENVVYRGQVTGVNVVAGGESSIGPIHLKPFVPGLQAPENESMVPADTAVLVWDFVEGASEYRIVVSESADLSDPLIDETSLRQDYAPSDLTIGQTYYWQVFALDAHGNMGIGSQIWSFTVDITSNLLSDPAFSKTASNNDKNYWDWEEAVEWGPKYGYDSSPGVRIAIDGNEHLIAELDGSGHPMKHSIKAGDRLWIQCHVKRSEGADGTFRVGVQEWDGDDMVLRNTIADVSTVAVDDTWELVTASVTIYDADAAFGHLLIIPHSGTTGYFYIDDVIFSRHEPAPTDSAENLLSDPTFSETISIEDYDHWHGADRDWGPEYGYNSSPGMRFTIDGNAKEFGASDGQGNIMRHPVEAGDKLWIQCRVKRSTGADGILGLGIQEWDGDGNILTETKIDVSTFAADDTWEWVSTSVNVKSVNAANCHLTIEPHSGTTGYFYIDDVIFSHHEPVVTENGSNMVLDPTFSKTASNTDHKYWLWTAPLEWGADYGYNSSPGIRYTIDGQRNALGELDGNYIHARHPVQVGDELWIQCRVKKSAGANGILRVGITELDKDYNHIMNTYTDASIDAEDTWEVVTGKIVVSDPNAAFCYLAINSTEGTTGFYYIDDVVFSRHKPY